MPPVPIQPLFDLAFEHHQAGRLAEAEQRYRQVLAAEPRHADSLHHLGILALQVGDPQRAAELIRHALALNANLAAAHSNLGEALRKLDRPREAIDCYRRALELQPGLAETHNNLGLALSMCGEQEHAILEYRRALQLQPAYAEAWCNLGIALRIEEAFDGAIDAFRRALQIQPDHVEALHRLATALHHRGFLEEAIAGHHRAIELQPTRAEFHNGLAITLAERGQIAEAITAHRHANRLKPDHAAMHSNLVYTLQFDPAGGEREIREEQQRWNRQFAEAFGSSVRTRGNDRGPERRLRVGYVSPDFRDHVIGRNLLPLFRHHDRQTFEIFCYSGAAKRDFLTDQFRSEAGQWRDTASVSDDGLAELIRQDAVDILVDLSQHLSNNRLPVFARQPAPVQVSFAGYPASTGLPAIGHRISDRYLESGSEYPAERVFLLDSFWCYEPGKLEVPVNDLPASTVGYVTFGSLNAFVKINEPVLRLWGRIMAAIKDARLVLLTGQGSHRQRTVEILRQEGVDPARVEFVSRQPHRAYLELYQRLDIALDPFPYGGHTTSLDALWMGVPVVSVAGTGPVSRAGLSQLSNLGLAELAAFSEDDYFRITTELAHDVPRLRALRSTLRERMQSSPLMDAARFARGIETAYRAMWRQWCGRHVSQ